MLVFLFTVILAAWIYPAIPQAERDALIALYNSADGDNWINNTNWRKPGDPTQFNDPGTENTWFGVNCDAGNTRVQTLTLTFNNLSGTIPVELNAINWLTTLDLSCNQLTGTIPDLSSLNYLLYLKLYQNNLGGNIPTWLNNLTLYHLNLYNNQFTGTIPDLTNNTGLGYLSLGGNQLTGTIPTWLNSFPYLYSLNLEGNQLTGTIPDLSSLTGLKYLYLSRNQLSGNIPSWINSFTLLYHLELSDNQLTGTIPDLSSLTDLQVLDLKSNQLSGTIPAWLNTLTQLLNLYLDNNQFTGPIPDLSSLNNLRYLHLENNQLSGDIPAGIGILNSLEHLYLNGNQLTGSLPGTLDGLTGLTDNTSCGGLNISWNGLYTDNTGLRDFLNTKQVGGDWESTQTIAPIGLSTSEETDNSVKISWTPIQYQSDSGGYRVYYSTIPGSGYTLAHTTTDKTVDNYTVADLSPGTTYYFVVKTITNSHANNQNTVVSDYSIEISGATTGDTLFTLTDPLPGSVLMQEDMAGIMWTTNGTVNNVELYYSTDNGSTWDLIDGPIPNLGYYDWIVPTTPSTQCLVKVVNADGGGEDVTDGVFTIRAPAITIDHPNGGQVLMQEYMIGIYWTHEGHINSVNIYIILRITGVRGI
jgi:Leucine-rich repeat (LRR) protein